MRTPFPGPITFCIKENCIVDWSVFSLVKPFYEKRRLGAKTRNGGEFAKLLPLMQILG